MTSFFQYILKLFWDYFNYTRNIPQIDKMQHRNRKVWNKIFLVGAFKIFLKLLCKGEPLKLTNRDNAISLLQSQITEQLKDPEFRKEYEALEPE